MPGVHEDLDNEIKRLNQSAIRNQFAAGYKVNYLGALGPQEIKDGKDDLNKFDDAFKQAHTNSYVYVNRELPKDPEKLKAIKDEDKKNWRPDLYYVNGKGVAQKIDMEAKPWQDFQESLQKNFGKGKVEGVAERHLAEEQFKEMKEILVKHATVTPPNATQPEKFTALQGHKVVWSVATQATMDYQVTPLAQHKDKLQKDLEGILTAAGVADEKDPQGKVIKTHPLRAEVEKVCGEVAARFEDIHKLRKTDQFQENWEAEKDKIKTIVDQFKAKVATFDVSGEEKAANAAIQQSREALLRSVLEAKPGDDIAQAKDALNQKLAVQPPPADLATLQAKKQLIDDIEKNAPQAQLQSGLQKVVETSKQQGKIFDPAPIEAQLKDLNTKIDNEKKTADVRNNLGKEMEKQLSDMNKLGEDQAKWMTDRLKKDAELLACGRYQAAMKHKGLPSCRPYYGHHKVGFLAKLFTTDTQRAMLGDDKVEQLGTGGYAAKMSGINEKSGWKAYRFDDGTIVSLRYDDKNKCYMATASGDKHPADRSASENKQKFSREMDALIKDGRIPLYMIPTPPSNKLKGVWSKEALAAPMIQWLETALNKQVDVYRHDKLPPDTTQFANSYFYTSGEKDKNGKKVGEKLYYIDKEGVAKEIEFKPPQKASDVMPKTGGLFSKPQGSLATEKTFVDENGKPTAPQKLEFNGDQFSKFKEGLTEASLINEDNSKAPLKDKEGNIPLQGFITVDTGVANTWTAYLDMGLINKQDYGTLNKLLQEVNSANPDYQAKKDNTAELGKQQQQQPQATGSTQPSPPPATSTPATPPAPPPATSTPATPPASNLSGSTQPSVPPPPSAPPATSLSSGSSSTQPQPSTPPAASLSGTSPSTSATSTPASGTSPSTSTTSTAAAASTQTTVAAAAAGKTRDPDIQEKFKNLASRSKDDSDLGKSASQQPSGSKDDSSVNRGPNR